MKKYSGFIILIISTFSATSQDIIRIDNFMSGEVGELPIEWGQREKDDNVTYQLMEEDGVQFLCAHSKRTDNFIIKKIQVDIVEYPYLNWKWKGLIFPPNGDESVKSTCDVVASMNVVLRASRWRPKTIKYSWSTTLEEGTRTASPFAVWPSRADIVVVQSGTDEKNNWVTEKVNVLEDYLKFYELENVDSYIVEAIVIMSDSDNTSSESKALYADIHFSKE